MKYLRKIRDENKLTQKQMAFKLGISYSHYTKLESGFVKPSFDLLLRVKNEFKDVDMNEFYK